MAKGPNKCPDCSASYSTKSGLYQHRRKKHDYLASNRAPEIRIEHLPSPALGSPLKVMGIKLDADDNIVVTLSGSSEMWDAVFIKHEIHD